MALLLNRDPNEKITRFVNLLEKQEVIRTVHNTLDGQQYIQRIGAPTISYELKLYVTEDGKRLLSQAEDFGSLLEARVQTGVFFGRIIELSDFKKLTTRYYEVTATLSKVTEV